MMAKLDLLDIPNGTREAYSHISERTWRYWSQANVDDFRKRCVVKIGRRVWLDAAAVAVWLEEHRGHTDEE
jgi:hypothetical protein